MWRLGTGKLGEGFSPGSSLLNGGAAWGLLPVVLGTRARDWWPGNE